MTIHHGEIVRTRLSQHRNKRVRTEFETFAESHGASADQQLCVIRKKSIFLKKKKNFFVRKKYKKKENKQIGHFFLKKIF